MNKKMDLTGVIDEIHNNSNGEDITVKEILSALNHRGYGPLLLCSGLLVFLPTGAIPGMPAIMSIFVMLLSGQMIYGKKSPWLPQKIKKFSFKTEKFETIRSTIKPYTQNIDRYIKPRFRFLANDVGSRIIGCICFILAISMGALGFIPFAAMLPSFNIILFGLGLSTKDGFIIIIASLVFLANIVATYHFMSNFLSG